MTDPAGVFPSDAHRHVMGHLSLPSDDYGWTASGLLYRLAPDPATWFTTADQVELFLEDLLAAGDVEKHGDGYRMSRQGFEKLTGPAVTEPETSGPAVVEITPDLNIPGRVPIEKPKHRFFKRRER